MFAGRGRVARLVLAGLVCATLLASAACGSGDEPETVASLLEEPIGIAIGGAPNAYDDERLNAHLDDIARLGAGWLRMDVGWSHVERERGTYDWSRTDRTIDEALQRGLAIVATITYTPEWARDPSCHSDKCEPRDADAFAAFAEATVERYAPRGVLVYELWNEPNSSSFWMPRANPEYYAELLRRAYPRMKAATDVDIQVLAGATAPAGAPGDPACEGRSQLLRDDGSMNPVDFVGILYDAGAGGSFDALSHHPYERVGFGYHRCSGWSQLEATSPSLRSVMEEHGDGEKPIWATEYGNDAAAVGDEEKAQRLREAIERWLAFPWAAGLMYYTYQDDACCEGYWLVDREGNRTSAWEAFRRSAERS